MTDRPAIAPPPLPGALDESGPRLRESEPKDLKMAKLYVAAFTDWLGIAGVCGLSLLQSWPPQVSATTIVALASGTIVGKLRGIGGGSTTLHLLSVPPAVKGALALLSTRFPL